MLFLILLFLIGIVIAYFYRYKNKKFITEDLCLIFFIALLASMILFLVFTVSNVIFTDKELYEEKRVCNIVSLRDHSNMSGNFILGTGYIDEKAYYSAYVYVGDNSYKKVRYEVDKTYIKETDQKVPHIKKKIFIRNIGSWFYPTILALKRHKYIIVVPENTIIKEFKLNN